MAGLDSDIWVVVAFPIIPAELLDIPPGGTVNLHASLLPRYRGAAPVQWALIHGEESTGLTTFFIDAGVDTGGICLQREVGILPEETAGELSERLSVIGAELMLETLDRVEEGTAPSIPQDPGLATPAPKLRKEDGLLDWSETAVRIVNRVRGMNPWPGSYSFLRGERILVLRARVVEGEALPWSGEDLPGPGAIGDFLEDGTPVVAAGDGVGVALTELQREGRRPAAGAEIIRGMRCEVGDIFGAG
jgi:methionyl-tRNA formyltransferase